MESSRIKNSVRNITVGLMYKIVSLLLPFVIRTIMINVLGVEYLGLNSLFSSILNVLNLAEFGFAGAITFQMYEPAASNDTERLSQLLSVYKRVYQLTGCIILILGLIVLPFIPHFINGSYPGDINIYIIYLIYLLNTVLSYLLFAYRTALFAAFQRLDLQNIISAFVMLSMYAIQIIFLAVTKNYYTYIFSMPVFTVINNIFVCWITKKNFPEIDAKQRVLKSDINIVTKKAGAMFGHKLNYVIVSSADSLVISSFLGLGILAKYSNYFTLMSAVIGVVDIVIQSLLPSVGNLLVEKNQEKTYHTFRILSFIQFWLVGWCSICLVCLYQPFMILWMGENMLLDFVVVVLLTIYFFSFKGRTIVLLFKDAAGMWNEDLLKPYISAGVNILLNILLVKIIGIYGVILSTIIAFAVISYPWETYVLMKKIIHKPIKEYVFMTLKYILQFFFLTIICYLICNMISNDGWGGLISKAAVCTVVPNALFIALNRKAPELKDMLSILSRFFYR